jgi:hypothetical protein
VRISPEALWRLSVAELKALEKQAVREPDNEIRWAITAAVEQALKKKQKAIDNGGILPGGCSAEYHSCGN